MTTTRCPHPRKGVPKAQCPYWLRLDPGRPPFCPTHGEIQPEDWFELATMPGQDEELFELADPP